MYLDLLAQQGPWQPVCPACSQHAAPWHSTAASAPPSPKAESEGRQRPTALSGSDITWTHNKDDHVMQWRMHMHVLQKQPRKPRQQAERDHSRCHRQLPQLLQQRLFRLPAFTHQQLL